MALRGKLTSVLYAFGVVSATIVYGTSPAFAQSKQLLEYPSIHSPVVGEHGMVVSQNALATKVGADIINKGGNAVDAAIAMGFALAVTLPRAGNIGGDGFMLINDDKTGKQTFIDFRSVAPKAAKLNLFIDDKGETIPAARQGYLAPSVPGTVAGLYYAHQKYGKLPWNELVAPAIKMAENGVKLSPDEAFVFSWGKERLGTSQAATQTYYKADGSLYKAGEVMKLPDLAWTLKQISAKGADGFYKGEVAKKFAADMKKHGGIITEADLANYKPVERAPLHGTYRGVDIVTAPPASVGGPTMLNILNILENFDLASMPAGSAKSLHTIAEAMKLGYIDRYKVVGDTDFGKPPIKGFISKEYAKERAKLINTEKATSIDALGAGDPTAFESVSTTHLSVADGKGGAVSMTYTLGSDFGSGVMIDGTGILLNNQMSNFSHEDTYKALKEHKPLPFNSMAPGKRMLSTMMPTFAFKDGHLWIVTGSPGGSTIIDTVTQVLINTIDYKLNIDEAIHQPRIFQGSTDKLRVEPNFNPDTIANLKAMGHPIISNETMGSAQSIMIEKGHYLGAADPRRPGALAIAPTGNVVANDVANQPAIAAE